jgi:hypothetical protein
MTDTRTSQNTDHSFWDACKYFPNSSLVKYPPARRYINWVTDIIAKNIKEEVKKFAKMLQIAHKLVQSVEGHPTLLRWQQKTPISDQQ